MKRFLIVILFYVSIMCISIIDIFLPSFIPHWSLSYLIILCVPGIPLIYIDVRNEMSFAKVINYNKSIYRKEKKEMNLYCRQLNLIINNQYLIEKLGEKNYKNKYKNKIEKINNRLGYYSNVIRPLSNYIIQFGLISLVLSVSTIIFEFISSSIQNTNISIVVIYFNLFLPLTSIFMSLIFYYLMSSSATGSLYDKKKILTKAKSSLSSKLKHATEVLQELEFGKD